MSSGKFTHAMCNDCWRKLYGQTPPIRMRHPETVQCCFCEDATDSGIWMRHEPDDLPCQGRTGVHGENDE